MLETWKKAYYATRLKIEESGKEQRWEFDKKKLFGKTDYIADIASELYNIAKVSFYIRNVAFESFFMYIMVYFYFYTKIMVHIQEMFIL